MTSKHAPNTRPADLNSPGDALAFLVVQTPKIGPTLQLHPQTSFSALPSDAKLCGVAASHISLLGRNLAGIRRLLGTLPKPATDPFDKPYPWAGFTVVPFRTATRIAVDSQSPFGNQIPAHELPGILSALGQQGHNAWITDLEGLLSVCYYGTHEPRRIGALLAAYLHGEPFLADMDAGCQIESRPGADKPIRLYFHTAETWMRTAGRGFATAATRRKTYALWRYQAMKAALVFHSLYQVPYEVVRAAPKGPLRTMELRAVGEPWLVDQRPCSVSIDRAKELRVVAHRFGSDLTLFHYAYLVDASGTEHFYAAYYCLLQDSEGALMQNLAALAEHHKIDFRTQAEDSDDPFE